MDKLVFSCFLLGGLTPDPGPTDSCGVLNGYCPNALTNVGCNPPASTGGSRCDGKSPVVIDLLAAEQNQILSFMNQKRNLFAAGEYGDPANRMFKLQWDANLATQAGHNARSCNIARDACRNTADFRNVGQMIGYFYNMLSAVSSYTVTEKINTVLDATYFNDYTSGSLSTSSYSASSNTENQANILNDRSKKVGCAMIQWDVGGFLRYFYLVCNFSDNVIEDQPLYTTAATEAMGCATVDTTYSSLCLT